LVPRLRDEGWLAKAGLPRRSLGEGGLATPEPWRRRVDRLNSRVRIESPQIQNFIDGQFVAPIGGKYLDNIEPATGKPYSVLVPLPR